MRKNSTVNRKRKAEKVAKVVKADKAAKAEKPKKRKTVGPKTKTAKAAKAVVSKKPVKKTVKKSAKRVQSPPPTTSQDEDELFDDADSYSDVTSSSEYDAEPEVSRKRLSKEPERPPKKRKRYAKRDFRSCFNNFFQLLNCVPHPSPMKIDIDSEMKLQRQRRLIELDRLRADSDDEDELYDLGDYLDFYDETLSETEKPREEPAKPEPHQVHDTLSDVTTGLEQVDQIIRQASEQDNDFFAEESDRIDSTELHTEFQPAVPPPQENAAAASSAPDCDLISATSSFKLLGEPQQLNTSLPTPPPPEPYPNPDTSIRIADYLTIDLPAEKQPVQPQRRNFVFPYRYNNDKLNLAMGEQEDLPCRPRALNKRALFYGSSELMVNRGHTISLSDFLS